MHPAPSVIIFTVFSGLGFGFLAFLAIGMPQVSGVHGFLSWAIGYAFAVIGLLASTFHLANPQRAWRAFSQWRSSWLSREGCMAVATLILLAPQAVSDIFGWGLPRIYGGFAALLCLITVFCTAMIYRQLRSVPRWHHPQTIVLFVTFMVAGGALMAGQRWIAICACVDLALALTFAFRIGDGLFAKAGSSLGSATGLERIGQPQVFEQPHTGGNYLMQEMIYVVGRKHAQKLRVISVVFAAILPALIFALLLPYAKHSALMLAMLSHLLGAFAARWLFFAEAEHVVGLYYGMR